MYKTAVIAGLLLGSFGVAALADWTPPANQPPTCPPNSAGCDAPINVGNTSQTKTGPLSVGKILQANTSRTPLTTGFQVFGKSIFEGEVQITAGTPAAKMILASKDALGNATWMKLSDVMPASGSGNTGWIKIDQGSTVYRDGGSDRWGVTWLPNTGTHSTENMCIVKGYAHATGACKFDVDGKNYFTTAMSNNERGQWIFTCNYGVSGFETMAVVDTTEILCTK
jgi:hypothetical protein